MVAPLFVVFCNKIIRTVARIILFFCLPPSVWHTATVVCACFGKDNRRHRCEGATFETGTTKDTDVIKVEICNKCHPYFTGKQKLVDAGGRSRATLEICKPKAHILRTLAAFHYSYVHQVRSRNAMTAMTHNLHTFGALRFWRMECAVRQGNAYETVLDVL